VSVVPLLDSKHQPLGVVVGEEYVKGKAQAVRVYGVRDPPT
jgi:hypothetical protein